MSPDPALRHVSLAATASNYLHLFPNATIVATGNLMITADRTTLEGATFVTAKRRAKDGQGGGGLGPPGAVGQRGARGDDSYSIVLHFGDSDSTNAGVLSVVSKGGAGQRGGPHLHRRTLRRLCRAVAALVAAGHRLRARSK